MPFARWGLLEGDVDCWSVLIRRVAYDVEAAVWAEQHAHEGDQEAAQLRHGLPAQ